MKRTHSFFYCSYKAPPSLSLYCCSHCDEDPVYRNSVSLLGGRGCYVSHYS